MLPPTLKQDASDYEGKTKEIHENAENCIKEYEILIKEMVNQCSLTQDAHDNVMKINHKCTILATNSSRARSKLQSNFMKKILILLCTIIVITLLILPLHR